jgi:hypothetical protein
MGSNAIGNWPCSSHPAVMARRIDISTQSTINLFKIITSSLLNVYCGVWFSALFQFGQFSKNIFLRPLCKACCLQLCHVQTVLASALCFSKMNENESICLSVKALFALWQKVLD